MKDITVGLFGTCGSSQWRDDFIVDIKSISGATYFNPQLPIGTWTAECADIENQHFKTDNIVLFPVTNESCGIGSLAEIGFSVSSLISNISTQRFFVFLIDDDCIDESVSNEQRYESVRSRKLVKSKLMEINHPNVFIVDNLIDMKSLMKSLINLSSQFQSVLLKYG